eukprot:4907627-Lingulodinium_polyedra.AAC.1
MLGGGRVGQAPRADAPRLVRVVELALPETRNARGLQPQTPPSCPTGQHQCRLHAARPTAST